MNFRCVSHGRLAARVLVLFGALLDLPAVAAPPVVVTIHGLGNPTATLSGPWQFHLGDDPAWSAPGFDDSGWEQLSADKPWGEQTHFNYVGYAWYRLHIDVLPVPGADPGLSLVVAPVYDVGQFWWNGALIGSYGRPPPHEYWPVYPTRSTFSLSTASGSAKAPVRSGVLAVRIWKAPYDSFGNGMLGGFPSAPRLGTPSAIAALSDQRTYQLLQRGLFEYASLLIYSLVSLLSLLAWLRKRSQKLLLALSVFTSGPLCLAVLGGGLPDSMSYKLALGILQPVVAVIQIALWFLLLYLLELDTNRPLFRWTRILAWILFISSTLDGLISLPSWSVHPLLLQGADGLLTAIFTVIDMFPLVLVFFAIRKRLDLARWLLAIVALLTDMQAVLRIALEQGSRFTHWTLGDKLNNPIFSIAGNPFTLSTILSTLLFVSILYAAYRFIAEQNERQAALEQEFASAQELQRVLIPEELPSLPGFSITSGYRPALQVGGDFFQLIALPSDLGEGSALLVLGDVSGKGLKAAMTVSLIVGSLRTLAELFTDPAEILGGLNRRLHGRLQNGFVTCLVLRLDPSGACTIASAGHPAPFLNGEEMSLSAALPLGLDPTVRYQDTELNLATGDHLTLFTDGLLEARNPRGELFGYDRLRSLVESRPDAADAIAAAVAFGQDDDITVLTLTRLEQGAQSTTSLSAPALVHAFSRA